MTTAKRPIRKTLMIALLAAMTIACEPSASSAPPSNTTHGDSCTPGDSFQADDGCNTCGCTESGKKSEALCTQMACTGCENDGDCDEGSTPPYCEGDVAYPSTYLGCNLETGQCELQSDSEPRNCADTGLSCWDGTCTDSVEDSCIPGESFLAEDGCNTCGCPESGKKSDGMCTLRACGGCQSDMDCGEGAISPYCDGDVAYPTTFPGCNQETGLCETMADGSAINCADEGLTCFDGACGQFDN